MQHPNKSRSSLFYKYLLSHMIIFLVPFIVVSAIFYHKSVESLHNEIIRSNVNKLNQLKDMMNARTTELEEIAMMISFDSRLTPYKVSTPYFDGQAINELKRYKVSSLIADDLLLYYEHLDQVYSPSGSGSLEVFADSIYSLAKADSDKFKQTIKALAQSDIRSMQLISQKKPAEHPYIAYLYPIPPHSLDAYGSVIFLIKQEKLTSLIDEMLGDFKGSVYIFNEHKEMLASHNSGKHIQLDNIPLFASAYEGITDEQVNGQKYSIITSQSDVNGWKFIIAIETAQFYGEVASLKMFIFIILLVIALAGIGLALLLTVKQYTPIRNLAHSLKSKKGSDTMLDSGSDEIESIQNTFALIYKSSEDLQQKVKTQQPLVRDQCLMRLLKGDVQDEREANLLLKDLQIAFRGPYFSVIMISLNQVHLEEKPSLKREQIIHLLADLSFREGVGYGVELIQDNAIALIINIDEQFVRPHLKQRFAEVIQKYLIDQSQSTPTIGVGLMYKGMNMINRSFIEASAAMEYTLVHRQGSMIFFEEIHAAKDETYWFAADEQVKLTQSLKQGNDEVANEAIEKFFVSLVDKESSFHGRVCFCFDIINTILKAILELNLKQYVNDVKALGEFKSLEELEGKMNALVVLICREVEERKESNNKILRDQILDFIRNHYGDYDLSLEQMGEVFQLSPSYISRFVKDQTGVNFTQYVWHLRVAQAKKQLKETDRSIKEIVADIGYLDVANFTRKFRQSEGITPGQFRMQFAFEDRGGNPL